MTVRSFIKLPQYLIYNLFQMLNFGIICCALSQKTVRREEVGMMLVFFVLLSGLPSSASTSTRSSRSCHLAVAEDRLALPAQSSSLPVKRWAESVDRVVRPHTLYPARSKSSGTAHVYGGFGVVSRPKTGRLGSVAEISAPTTSLAPPRQSEACAIRRRPLVRLPLLAAG